MVCVLYVTCDRCPGVCIDWLNALLIRLDWPLQTTHLDLTILPFPSHLFPPHFLLVPFILNPQLDSLTPPALSFLVRSSLLYINSPHPSMSDVLE